jgi:hypothetical protein
MTASTISPLRQRMIEDMNARNLCEGTQRGHIRACKRFAAFLKRSPDTAEADDVRRFQLHLMEDGASIQTRNRTMTGLRFLLRVTLRRHDLAAEVTLNLGFCKARSRVRSVGLKKSTPLTVQPSIFRGRVTRSSSLTPAEKSSSAERWAR